MFNYFKPKLSWTWSIKAKMVKRLKQSRLNYHEPGQKMPKCLRDRLNYYKPGRKRPKWSGAWTKLMKLMVVVCSKETKSLLIFLLLFFFIRKWMEINNLLWKYSVVQAFLETLFWNILDNVFIFSFQDCRGVVQTDQCRYKCWYDTNTQKI